MNGNLRVSDTMLLLYYESLLAKVFLYVFKYTFRSAFELWGHGRTASELKSSVLEYPEERMVCVSRLIGKLYHLFILYKFLLTNLYAFCA